MSCSFYRVYCILWCILVKLFFILIFLVEWKVLSKIYMQRCNYFNFISKCWSIWVAEIFLLYFIKISFFGLSLCLYICLLITFSFHQSVRCFHNVIWIIYGIELWESEREFDVLVGVNWNTVYGVNTISGEGIPWMGLNFPLLFAKDRKG